MCVCVCILLFHEEFIVHQQFDKKVSHKLLCFVFFLFICVFVLIQNLVFQ